MYGNEHIPGAPTTPMGCAPESGFAVDPLVADCPRCLFIYNAEQDERRERAKKSFNDEQTFASRATAPERPGNVSKTFGTKDQPFIDDGDEQP